MTTVCGGRRSGKVKMAYDEVAARRLRLALSGQGGLIERKMFGGIAFLVRGNMCVGVQGETLMVRVGKEKHNEAVMQPFARPMDITGTPMQGYIYVEPPGYANDADLRDWVQRSLDFVLTLPAK